MTPSPVARAVFLVVASFLGLHCQSGTPGGPDAGLITAPGCESFAFTNAVPAGWTHVATCEETCGNGLNPPTGGPHCGQLIACRTHTSAQLRCQWIHNLEHGHAVFAYNCPSGCPEIVSALDAIRAAVPAGSNGTPRAILTPDSALPTKVAAIVAGWSYVSETVDSAAIACLLTKQDVHAPEANFSCSP